MLNRILLVLATAKSETNLGAPDLQYKVTFKEFDDGSGIGLDSSEVLVGNVSLTDFSFSDSQALTFMSFANDSSTYIDLGCDAIVVVIEGIGQKTLTKYELVAGAMYWYQIEQSYPWGALSVGTEYVISVYFQ